MLSGKSLRLRAFLTLLTTVTVSASVWVAASEPCNVKAERQILLSGDRPDTISVLISGPTCLDATLTVRIFSASGSDLYQCTIPFRQFHSVTGDPPYIEAPSNESANRIANEIIHSPGSRKVENLLPYFSGERDNGIEIRKFVLSEDSVLRLRQQPIFTLTTGWESWAELAFDPQRGEVLAVAEAWM